MLRIRHRNQTKPGEYFFKWNKTDGLKIIVPFQKKNYKNILFLLEECFWFQMIKKKRTFSAVNIFT